MTILVTGAAGFIGCNNVLALNRQGINDVVAVDNLAKAEKFLNLAKCRISDYFDKVDFIERVRKGTAPVPEAIFHQGACSDTMQTDGRYMMQNNYRYTLELFEWAQELRIPFIYASSAATYGASTTFVESIENYGKSIGKPKYFVEQLETGFLPLTEENVTLVLSLYGKTLKEFIAWRPKELQYPNYMPPKDMTQIHNNKKESFSNTEENKNFIHNLHAVFSSANKHVCIYGMCHNKNTKQHSKREYVSRF